MLRRPTLSERSVEELRAMAAEYRRMAGTGSTPDVTEALLRVTRRLENLILHRDLETSLPEATC